MGHRERYRAVPIFWTEHFDLSIRYVGHATSWDELKVEGDLSDRDGLVRFVNMHRLLAVATVEHDLYPLTKNAPGKSPAAPAASPNPSRHYKSSRRGQETKFNANCTRR